MPKWLSKGFYKKYFLGFNKESTIAGSVRKILSKEIYFCSVINSYLFSAQDKHCPFCESLDVAEVANKIFFLKLFRCNRCAIMFRYPKDKKSSGALQDQRLAFEPKASYLPGAEELAQLKLKKFKNTVYDISDKIEAIKKHIDRGEILDYGASWGYNLWQFLEEGFSGQGYEISLKRATYGEQNLGLKMTHDPASLGTLESHFDIVFANQVLEHVYNIKKEFARIYGVLKTNGLLIIYVPDCTDIEKEEWRYIYAFGERHPLAFSREFFIKNLPSLGFQIIEIEKCEKLGSVIKVVARKRGIKG